MIIGIRERNIKRWKGQKKKNGRLSVERERKKEKRKEEGRKRGQRKQKEMIKIGKQSSEIQQGWKIKIEISGKILKNGCF